MNTRKLFETLEFEENWAAMTDRQPGYFCNFGNLLLEAVEVTNKYFQPVFLLTGVWQSPRTLAMIESQIPMTVASFEQGVALIAYAIGDDFEPLIVKEWLTMGRKWRDQLPWEIDRRKYDARPQCVVERDWFRVAARKMRESVTSVRDDELAWFGFDGMALSIAQSRGLLVMPAIGNPWPERYAIQANTLKYLPQRLPNPIYLSVWDHRLTINRRCWSIIETEPFRKPKVESSICEIDQTPSVTRTEV